MELAPTLPYPNAHYIMNPGIFGTQTYSLSLAYPESRNIQKFDVTYILLRYFVMSFSSSSRL